MPHLFIPEVFALWLMLSPVTGPVLRGHPQLTMMVADAFLLPLRDAVVRGSMTEHKGIQYFSSMFWWEFGVLQLTWCRRGVSNPLTTGYHLRCMLRPTCRDTDIWPWSP